MPTVPVPQKIIARLLLQTLAGDHFLALRKPVFDSSPWRRRAEGTASRKCRRSPGPDSAIELPTRATLARGRRKKKTKRPAVRRSFDSAGGFPSFDSGSTARRRDSYLRSRRSPDARRPTGTTRPTVICGSRHAVVRWTFATPRIRGVVVHLSFSPVVQHFVWTFFTSRL